MTLDQKSKVFSSVVIIILLLIVAYVIGVIVDSTDWEVVNKWFEQPITSLNIIEFIVIICVCNIIFGGSK